MFDPEKLNEYKIRILLSLLIMLLVIFAIFYRGISGIASIEVIFVGLLFSIVSLLHASWAILKIKKLEDKIDYVIQINGKKRAILNEKKVDQYVIKMTGNFFQDRFLNMIHYGDWLSYWCAIAHNTDPSPVTNIDRLKTELKKI